jgi:hypothetical protein
LKGNKRYIEVEMMDNVKNQKKIINEFETNRKNIEEAVFIEEY